MKLTKYFMPFAALALLASCTDDKIIDVNQGSLENSAWDTKDGVYVNVNITPIAGTRTTTSHEGTEIGQDNENAIKGGYFIFATTEEKDNSGSVIQEKDKIVVITKFEVSSVNGENYVARGKVVRQTLINNILGDEEDESKWDNLSKKYELFVVCNPSPSMVLKTGENATEKPGYIFDESQTDKPITLNSNILNSKELTQIDVKDLVVALQNTLDPSSALTTKVTHSDLWSNASGFLMSNGNTLNYDNVIIAYSDIKGTLHSTENDALQLTQIDVQRAVARFDIDVNKYLFVPRDGGNPLETKDIKEGDFYIELVEASVFNEGNDLYLFKQVGDDYNTSNWTLFGQEWGTGAPGLTFKFVRDPKSEDKVNDEYFFSKKLYGDVDASGKRFFNVEQLNLPFIKWYTATASDEVKKKWLPTNTPYFNPTGDKYNDGVTSWDGYRGLAYVIPNSILDANAPSSSSKLSNQKHGNTTGVVFKAQIHPDKAWNKDVSKGEGYLYAYQNTVYGGRQDLLDWAKTYWRLFYVANNPEAGDDFEDEDSFKDMEYTKVDEYMAWVVAAIVGNYDEKVKNPAYEEAKKKADEEGTVCQEPEYIYVHVDLKDPYTHDYIEITNIQWDDEEKEGEGDNGKVTIPGIDLAKDYGVSVYPESSDGNYYCYYYYWNRHNDNYDPEVTDIMEFAVVRNNIYKLAVNKINLLGHPADPSNDPDPIDPDDPNENPKEDLYISIGVSVLPWSVRVNNIEF